jgi:beta-xylosidase
MVDKLFKKEGVFAAALFANDELTLDAFDEQHLIYQLPIKGLWKPKPVLFQADSFLFVKGEELFLFYELQHWDDPGYIVMTKTSDLKTWTKPVIVLQEPFHLSFPYVFEDNGSIYMVPESQESDSIRLYQANDSLTSFTFVRTLLKKEREEGLHYNLNDSHIYKQEGKYYLFTSYQKDWMYYQELYVTEDLLNGTFVRHPQSPICTSNEYGRNGGSLIQYGNKLLRVTQDCHQNYGDNISLMEVTQLDEQHYQEQLYMRNVFPQNSIFMDGGHQLNIIQYKGQYIYATDYKVNKWAWYKPYIGLLVKLRLHKKRG